LLLGHAQAVAGVVFIDGGTLLASGSADGDIRLWDVDTHEWVGTLSDRSKSIRSLAKDPRRQRLASMDDDDDLIFWDVGFEDWVTRACRIANRELTAREWSTYLGAGPPRNTCPAP
jgi:WD40 repeat protein